MTKITVPFLQHSSPLGMFSCLNLATPLTQMIHLKMYAIDIGEEVQF